MKLSTLRTSKTAATGSISLTKDELLQDRIEIDIDPQAKLLILNVNNHFVLGNIVGPLAPGGVALFTATIPAGILIEGENKFSLGYTLAKPIAMGLRLGSALPALPEAPTNFQINPEDKGDFVILHMSWVAGKGATSHVMHMSASAGTDPDDLPPVQSNLGTTWNEIAEKASMAQMRMYCPAGVNLAGRGPCSADVMVTIPALSVTPPVAMDEPSTPINLRIAKSVWRNNKSLDTLMWDAVPGAYAYNIYSYNKYLLGTSTAPLFAVPEDKSYPGTTYTVTAIVGGVESIPSALSFYGQPPESMGIWGGNMVGASEDLVCTTVWDSPTKPVNTLSWVNKANGMLFNIFRDGIFICGGISRLYYVDASIVPGKSYKYEVQAEGLLLAAKTYGPKDEMTMTVPLTPHASYRFGVSLPVLSGIKTKPNDDSVLITIPKSAITTWHDDYRAYVKGTQNYKYAGAPLTDVNHNVLDVEIEVNGLDPAKAPYTIIVEALDRQGPFQTMDGVMPIGHMVSQSGPAMGMSIHINGQGDPSNRPIVLARSEIVVSALVPFKMTGTQRFLDTFRGNPTITEKPDPLARPRVHRFVTDKWDIYTHESDYRNTVPFIMSNHFMDVLYDGGDTGPQKDQGPPHNNIASLTMQPLSAVADITGGKTIRVFGEVDACNTGRRWWDFILTGADDVILAPAFTKLDPQMAVTKSGNFLIWQVLGDVHALDMTIGDGTNNGRWVRRQPQISTYTNDPVLGVGREGFVSRQDINDDLPFDRRVPFELYASENMFALVVGGKVLVSRPLTEKLPWTRIKPGFVHHVYHTGEEVSDNRKYNTRRGCYFYNYRPFCSELHWDNMGFEVLDTFPFPLLNALPFQK